VTRSNFPLSLLLALLSCAPVPAPAPQATPLPAAPQFTAAQRVVLLSFDGLGADALARQTGLAAFDRAARDGASARVIPVNPTLTVPAHVAILTGADPQVSGIVSNRIHLLGTPDHVETRTMMLDPDVESIVEIARRAGKRVGAVPFPTIDGKTPRRTADFGLAWTEPVVRGRTITLSRGDFKREWVPPTWTATPSRRPSFSPVMRARIEWAVPRQARVDIDLVAYDQTDDRVENYDAIFLESGGFESAPDAKGWFPISIRTADGLHGSWSKLLRADAALNDVAIYWGPISRTDAYPASFRELLDTEAGFWPGRPDEAVDPRTFSEQLARLTEFLAKAQAVTIERMPFDLLLAYHSTIDEASHPYLARNQDVIREAWLAADRALDTVTRAVDRSRDALVVTGDHGLLPTETELRMNAVLRQHGFAEWRAFASGYSAQIYGSGDSTPLVDFLNGYGQFERVETKAPGAHRNGGDVVVYARPGVSLSSSSDDPPVVQKAGRGEHGALNTHRELHTVLFASGAGVSNGSLGEIPQTKVFGLVRSLLGV